MHLCAAEFFIGDFLPDRGFDQGLAGQVQARALGHEQRVAEDGQVSAARHAETHDRGDLGDAFRRDHRVVAEDPAEVVGVGEDIFLQRQEDARGVDEVDERQPRHHRDLLGADDLLAGHREEGTRFHRRIVGDDHAAAALHQADAGDHARRGGAAVLTVHAEGGPEAELLEVRDFNRVDIACA